MSADQSELGILADTQSTIFYSELLPALYRLSIACQLDRTLILDIGPGTCAGTALLHNALNRLLAWPVEFTAIDITGYYEKCVRSRFPFLKYVVGSALYRPTVH